MIQLRNQGFGVGSTHSILGSVLLLVSWSMPVIWLNCRETSTRWTPRFAGSVKLPFIEFSRRYLPDEASIQKSHWSIPLLHDASGLMVVSYSWCRASALPHYWPSICILTAFCWFIWQVGIWCQDWHTVILISWTDNQRKHGHCWTLAIVGTLTGPASWDSWEDPVEVVLRGCHSQISCKLQFCTETWHQYLAPNF